VAQLPCDLRQGQALQGTWQGCCHFTEDGCLWAACNSRTARVRQYRHSECACRVRVSARGWGGAVPQAALGLRMGAEGLGGTARVVAETLSV